MRTRTGTWIETKVKYQKTQEDGTEKMVTEPYVVDALSFTEAENSIIEEMSVYVSGEFQVKAVKKALKGKPFDEWAEVLRSSFNADSVIRIRVEKGIFKMGDNALVDNKVFRRDVKVEPLKEYPIDATYGKVLKKGPKEYTDVKALVIADYQDVLEKEWVAELRKKYKVVVNQEVLATVNKH